MPLEKRSITLAGHRTSVALEPEFWAALTTIAKELDKPLGMLLAELDSDRQPEQPLTSLLRVFALKAASGARLQTDS